MEKKDDYLISEEMAEWVGLKKSEYLSLLIQKGRPGDIGFEQYHLFDQHITQTLENPDKVFERNEENQLMRIYLRTYQTTQEFHQVVIGVVVNEEESSVFIPILTFVSKDRELVKDFCAGEVITRPTLN